MRHNTNFEQLARTLLKGSNACKKCVSDSIIKGKRRPLKFFIENAKKKHGDKYIYDEVIYVDLKTKVTIFCPLHGNFLQSPENHIRGAGCHKCSNVYKPTTDEFINEAKTVHGNKYDYSLISEYKGRKTKVIIVCRLHGEFEQTPDSHIRGNGCPKCAGNYKSDTQEFLEKCKFLPHIDQYNLSKVEYTTAIIPVIIICQYHGEFLMSPNNFLSGHGCSICAGNQRKNLDTFIQQAQGVHKNEYDYDFVEYVNNRTNIAIRCYTHGIFLQLPSNHLKGAKCPLCQGCMRYTRETYIQKALEVHSHKYSYDKLVFINSSSYVSITCKDHGDFYQNAQSHLRGAGCKKCATDKLAMSRRLTTHEFIDKLKKVHGNRYDYSKVIYLTAITPVTIVCRKHGQFNATPNYLLSGHNCPRCARFSRYSKKSLEWLNFMNIINPHMIKHGNNGGEFRITGTRFFADGYCQETNTIYEFHGDYWHGNPKRFRPDDKTYYNTTFQSLYEKTIERDMLIMSKGYNLIVLWESDWDIMIKGFRILQKIFLKRKSKTE